MPSWLLFVLLCFAAYRVQHFITSDVVPGEWVRKPLLKRSNGKGGYLFEFISCHYCLGTWLTWATFAVAAQFVVVRLPVLQALAGSAVVGLLGEWEAGD